jgi:hypothetical protein
MAITDRDCFVDCQVNPSTHPNPRDNWYVPNIKRLRENRAIASIEPFHCFSVHTFHEAYDQAQLRQIRSPIFKNWLLVPLENFLRFFHA